MPNNANRTDDIVVDLAYVDLVRNKIHEMGTKLHRANVPLGSSVPRERDRDERLGLSIIEVSYQADAVVNDATVGRLLRELRKDFEQRLGWAPTMGRNRVLAHVGGFAHSQDAAKPTSFIQGGVVEPTSFIQGGSVSPASFIQGGGGGFPKQINQLPAGLDNPKLGQGVRVGVIDTPLFLNEALLGSCLADRSSILPRSDEPYAYLSGHATFVAGLIEAKAPAAAIELHHVLRPSDAGASAWDVARTMAELIDSGIDVLNLSLGCFTSDNEPPLLLKRAIELLTPHIVVVAAAGNYRAVKNRNGTPIKARPFWPAALDEVVAIGADKTRGKVAPFSADYPWVAAYAPGVDVMSTYLDGKVAFPPRPKKAPKGWPADTEAFTGAAKWSGTSFSAATVSGAIAARTIPGRRTSREALDQLLSGSRRPDPDVRPA